MIHFIINLVLAFFAGWKVGDLLIAAWKWRERRRRARRLVIPPGRHMAITEQVTRRGNKVTVDYRLLK